MKNMQFINDTHQMLNQSNKLNSSVAQGYTLVELMIGLLISLLVGGVAISYLTTSSRIIANQNAEDVIQENVRFAFEIMSSTLRLAGSNVSVNPQTFEDEKNPIFKGTICAGNKDCNADNVKLTGAGTDFTETDSAAFSYISNSGTTCTGVAITTEQQVVTQFFVADLDNDNVSSLYCQAYVASLDYVTQSYAGHSAPNANPVALIDGVESFQVQYGVDMSVPTNSTVDSYFAYSNIPADKFTNIRSVKLGLLFSNAQEGSSFSNTEQSAAAVTYQILDGQATISDRILRQVATTTVFLPNS